MPARTNTYLPSETPLISVTIVCHNSARDIRMCMAALRSQTWENFEIIVIDNASGDDSVALLREYPEVRLIENPINTGFSAAQNQAVRACRAEWIVCLNLDTRAEPAFLEEMWLAMQVDGRIGVVSPKLLRMERDGSSSTPPLIDSTGCYATPEMRHHNRGSQQPDTGQYDRPEYVFGFTGAAAMFRRTMLDDVAVNGCFFDEDFFVCREDNDLSWRLQLYGWSCLYTPYAVVYHRRHIFENNRDSVSPLINMHSTKNRFLLRINNVTPRLYRQFLLPATLRDIGVILYCLFKERTSLPGLAFVWRERSRLLSKRRTIQGRHSISHESLSRWFSDEPVALPLEPHLVQRLDQLRQARTVAPTA